MQAKLAAVPPPASDASDAPPTDDEENQYEMMWDCKFCGTAKLLGVTHRYCPNCGAAQDASQRYFPADDEKVAAQDHQFVGADKVCAACDTPNAATTEFCVNCGSPMSEVAEAQKLAAESRAVGESFQRSSAQDQASQAQAEAKQVAEDADKSRRFKLIAIGVVALIAVLIGVFVLWTKEVSVIATGHAWEREIKIEDYATRSKGDWCDSMPHDAYSVSREQKIRSHKKIPDGQECSTQRIDQGDGTYKEVQDCRTKYRDEPVYDTYCKYRVDRWEYKRSVNAEGNNKKPQWPRYQLHCEGQRKGCERENGREEAYILMLKNSATQEEYRCSIGKNLWERAAVNSKWKLEVSAISGGARCDALQPLF
jgi:predicted nucleic acid-binding Zn ribbon protein